MPESTNQWRESTIVGLFMVPPDFMGDVLWFVSHEKGLAGTANL